MLKGICTLKQMLPFGQTSKSAYSTDCTDKTYDDHHSDLGHLAHSKVSVRMVLNSGVESYPCGLNLLKAGDQHCLRQSNCTVRPSHRTEGWPRSFGVAASPCVQLLWSSLLWKLTSENSILQTFSEKIPLFLCFLFFCPQRSFIRSLNLFLQTQSCLRLSMNEIKQDLSLPESLLL